MKVYVVVEMFKGDKPPEIKGVYQAKAQAEEIKDNYRFAFIDEQTLIQAKAEQTQPDVFVVYELLKLNVPRVIGVFKNEDLAKATATDCEYPAYVVAKQLLYDFYVNSRLSYPNL